MDKETRGYTVIIVAVTAWLLLIGAITVAWNTMLAPMLDLPTASYWHVFFVVVILRLLVSWD